MRRPALLASSLLLAAGLSGCGGGDVEAYCQAVKKNQNVLETGPAAPASFDKLTAAIDEMASTAPSDIEPEWQRMQQAFEEFTTTLEDGGFSQEELRQIQQDPSQVDPQKLQKLQDVATEAQKKLDGAELDKAGDQVNAFTKKNCGEEPFAGS